MESLRRALDATLQYTMSAYDNTPLEETNPNAWLASCNLKLANKNQYAKLGKSNGFNICEISLYKFKANDKHVMVNLAKLTRL